MMSNAIYYIVCFFWSHLLPQDGSEKWFNIIPIGSNAQKNIIYSTQTLYLGNSPPCGVNNAMDKLAYNNIPPDENNNVYNFLFHNIINDDIFTSNIEINELVKKIKIISTKNFTGIVNVGSKRHSDYIAYKKFKSSLKPCRRKDIIKNLNISLAKDSSMNLSLFNKITK